MPARQYSSIAPLMSLTASINSAVTTMVVDTTSGLPSSTPFTLGIDMGTISEELVDVTAVAGLTLTITRGVAGTSAVSHAAGAGNVRHAISSRDFSEPQQHIYANSGVHGVAGAVVGTTDTQSLTHKTIDATLNTIVNLALTDLPSSVSTSTKTETLSNKSISGSANTLTNIPNSALSTGIDAGKVASVASSFVAKSALPTDTVYTDATQTLTGKTISGSANTLTNLPGGNITGAASIAKSVLPSDSVYNVDTGNLTGTAAIVAASGWTDAGCRLRIHNGVAYLDVAMTRNGATITASANGSIADTVMGTLAAAQSANYPTGNSKFGMASLNATTATMRVASSGDVVIAATYPNGDINNGDTLNGTLTWLV